MTTWRAQRLEQLPPYLFVEIDRRKREAIAAGKDVINFGIGDPDLPTPKFIVDTMADAIREPANHRYPPDKGRSEFRNAAAAFCKRRFDVSLDAETQVLTLIGTKEGLGHLPLAVLNPGDVALVPDPGYPVYQSTVMFVGAEPIVMPLRAENGWLPDLDAIPADVCRRARLMYLNYPNNPTSAVADRAFLEQAVAFARKHDLLIAQDAAYSEVFFEQPPPSILQIPGAMDVAIELHSLSKTFSMTGWRIGFAAGNESAIASLAKVKSNMDSSQFAAVQLAGAAALDHADHVEVRAMLDTYRQRRDLVVDGLRGMGIDVDPPRATFYVWARCPSGLSSMDFVAKVLDEAAVVVIPGVGFGRQGEGWFRMALTVGAERTKEALDRMAKVMA